MGCVEIGVYPSFLTLTEGGRISEIFVGHQKFQGSDPVLEVSRAIILFDAVDRRL